MTKKSILIATNLDVWSIKKGVGAPSFYKTLELYNNKKFKVYFYTTEKNCDISELTNIEIIKLPKLKTFNIRYIYSIHRLVNYVLYQFIFLFFYFSKQKEKIDLIYGYEIEFIPSLCLLSKILKKPFVSRFQGTILYPLMEKKLWEIRYFPHYFSIKQKSDLTIMTDDGTKGDYVMDIIRNGTDNMLFLKNGVDFLEIDKSKISRKVKSLYDDMISYEYNFISVSRLQSWKRVDRSIDVFSNFAKINTSSRYIIIGDGESKKDLEEKVKNEIDISDKVIFTGGLNAQEVHYLMSRSKIFLSHYELSNVGNPLWEAINNNCLIVTVNNGDTGRIIVDNQNGIISEENDYLENSSKLLELVSKTEKMENLIYNAKNTLTNNVSTWDKRMQKEYIKVNDLL